MHLISSSAAHFASIMHVEKLQFELERQKWSKSLAEKNSTVQQLERELSSTVNALHEAMQATHDLNNSSSSSSSVALSHSPHHKNGYHHHHDDSLHHNSVHHRHHNGNIYYDEDGRKKDDRVGTYRPECLIQNQLAFLPLTPFLLSFLNIC